MSDLGEFELEDGERIVWSERRTISLASFLRQRVTVIVGLVVLSPTLDLARPRSLQDGALSLDLVLHGIYSLVVLGGVGALALFYAWIRETVVTFTERKVVVVAAGSSRSARFDDVTAVEVAPDRLVFRVARVDKRQRRASVWSPTSWFVGEEPPAIDRLACPGLDDPRRVLQDLIAAGALAADVEVVDRTREARPSLWRPALLTLLGLALWIGGLAAAKALRETQGVWVSGAVLLGGIGLGLLPLVPGLRALTAAWTVPAEDA